MALYSTRMELRRSTSVVGWEPGQTADEIYHVLERA